MAAIATRAAAFASALELESGFLLGGEAVVEGLELRQHLGHGGDSGFLELEAGLQAGQQVVVEGSDRLADGVPITVAGAGGPRSTPAATGAATGR